MNRTKPALQRYRPMNWVVWALIMIILLSACQPAPAPTQPPVPPSATPVPTAVEPVAVEPTDEPEPVIDLAPQLVDRLWILVGYGDASNPIVVEEGTIVTAVFGADGNLSGSGGCNNFSTSYELTGDAVTVGSIASTLMACERGMNQETVVLAALQNARQIAFSPEGRLEIYYDSGSGVEQKLVYTLGETPLEETVWVLQSLGTPDNPTGVERGTVITAIFNPEGTLSGTSGCNNYTASFSVDGSQIGIQQGISTLMACSRGMEQEAAYLEALTGAESFVIRGSQLEIRYNQGTEVLVFTSRNLTLENTLWTLATMNGERNTAGLVATTALFDPGTEPGEGTVGGVAMCNNYRGGYTVEDGNLTVSEVASTMIRCPENVMQAEATYFKLLETAQSYQVFGQTLTVTSEMGNLTFVANRAPLEGTSWRLNSLGSITNPQAPVAGADFTAQFVRQANAPSGLMIGSTGCNDYNAVYTANLNEIKVNLPARTNNTGCQPGVFEQEQVYFLALNAASNYRILGDNLQIPYGGDQMLSFTAFVPELAPAPSGGPLTVLNGTRWWLVSMGNAVLRPGSEVTAEFAINADGETGAINGTAGCNTYNAPILGVLQVGPAATTKVLCADPAGVMEQEAAYLAMLATANSFSQAYNQLVIGTTSGLLVYYNSPAPVVPVEPPARPTGEPPASVTPEMTPEAGTPTPPAETEPVAPPPAAVISGPTEADVDQIITFDARGSTSEVAIESYKWDFGDGSVGEGISVEHAFTAPGTYTITLTVVDANGLSGTTTLTVTIS